MRRVLPVAAVLALAFPAAAQVLAASPAACPGAHGAPDEAVTGTFGDDLEGSHVMVPFDVPDGLTRIRVKLCHDDPPTPAGTQLKHTLDLGLYEAAGRDGLWGPEEFRGWGGSSRRHLLVTPEGDNVGAQGTTVGFLPGPIVPGRWAAEIGVAAVAGPEEGDPDASVDWRLEVFFGSTPEDVDDPWSPAPYDTSPARRQPGWYKGDFHVHARHSNPGDATMQEVFDYAFAPPPRGAGLDFITLSDYVTSRHWYEIGRFQHAHPGKLVVRSAEIVTYRGHVNNHGSAAYVDHRAGPVYEYRAGRLVPLREAQPARRILKDIHRAGGWTQVNHPTIFPSTFPGFGNLCRGCSWDYSDEETGWAEVDAFEVQTGPSGTSQPEGHEIGPNPFTPDAVGWWDELYTRGYRMTGVGSSDSHHAGGGNGVTQSPIGEAATVVYAEELSEAGIREAVLAGHAYVKFFSPQGPDLRLTARALDAPSKGKGTGRKAMMGDRLRASAALFEARVLGAAPSPEPRLLVVFKDGRPYLTVPVTSDDFSHTFDVADPAAYRLQLQRGSAIEALTNPITLVPRGRGATGI